MARGNKYTCVVCGTEHTFCPKCQTIQPNYDYERYCCKSHADIFNILSKHGCGLVSAEETLESLKPYDLTGLNESIQAHINSLKPANTEAEKEVETTYKTSKFRTQE